MSYVTAEARQELLRDIAGAIDVLAQALAACAPAPLPPVGYGVFRM